MRTIVADNHSLFRAGVVRLLRDVKTIDVVGGAESGEEAVDLVRTLNPHVVSLEIAMPGMGGLEAARRILKSKRGTQVVMLTGAWNPPFPAQSLRAGVCGFVTKRGARRCQTGLRPQTVRQLGYRRAAGIPVVRRGVHVAVRPTVGREMRITLMW